MCASPSMWMKWRGTSSHSCAIIDMQQRVARDVERHAEREVGGALIELAIEPAIVDVELEQRVTRRQLHLRDVRDVPRADDDPARHRIALDRVDRLLDLVDAGRRPSCATDSRRSARARRSRRPTRPRSACAAWRSSLMFVEPRRNHSSSRTTAGNSDLLRRDEREALAQVVAGLRAEHRERAGARAIGAALAVIEHVAKRSR